MLTLSLAVPITVGDFAEKSASCRRTRGINNAITFQFTVQRTKYIKCAVAFGKRCPLCCWCSVASYKGMNNNEPAVTLRNRNETLYELSAWYDEYDADFFNSISFLKNIVFNMTNTMQIFFF